MTITMTPIGTVSMGPTTLIRLDKEYAPGLEGLEGFSHVLVYWHAHNNPPWDSANLTVPKPYRLAPARLGIFATRSEFRPNPILVSAVPVIRVDAKRGEIEVPWIDAEDGSPVLDIKPYQPSADRIRDVDVPEWCRHWPAHAEESGDFAWHEEFMF
jgi:tRNA-Thr(GGU) m(6)t(6)A37 methyltransferase TsaA